MARKGWFGLPFIGTKSDDSKTGLVLSGGGTRSSFQLGALKYLYQVQKITPQVFVGTSAGAITAAVLAQYATAEEQAQAIEQLEQLWRGLTCHEDVFIERSWFTRLRGHEGLLEVLAAEPKRGNTSLQQSLARLWRRDQVEQAPTSEGDALARALAPDEQPTEWTPGMLVSVLSNIGKLGKAGTDLPQIWQGADRSRSAYRPGALLGRLLDPDLFNSVRVATSGMTLRVAMVGLTTGEVRYMREDGIIVGRDDRPISDESHDLAIGVLASSAIPAVFAPVELGDELYVDGAVREVLPAEMGLGQLRASPVYAVVCSPAGVPPDHSLMDADIVSLMMRSATILQDEALSDEIAYARSAGAIVIEPEVDVHDTLAVDPGLIAINFDYGWMRAAEVCLQASPAHEAINRRVTELRVKLHHLVTRQSESREDIMEEAELQRELQDALAKANPALLPAGSQQWVLPIKARN